MAIRTFECEVCRESFEKRGKPARMCPTCRKKKREEAGDERVNCAECGASFYTKGSGETECVRCRNMDGEHFEKKARMDLFEKLNSMSDKDRIRRIERFLFRIGLRE